MKVTGTDHSWWRALLGGVIAAAVLGPLASVTLAAPPLAAFAVPVELPTGTYPQSVALGDLDDDGDLDLVVVNRGWLAFGPSVAGSVSVALGDGSGAFGERTDYALGSQVRSVALEDLNGDTHLDLVVSASGTGLGKVWVLLGDGTGAFGPAAETVAGSNLGPGSLAVVDLDGDTIPDVAVADSESVNVLLGSGTGGFTGDPEWPVLENLNGTLPSSVTAGHLDADDIVDLVSTNLEGTVSVLLGVGDGTFLPSIEYAVGSDPRSAAPADLDGDGAVDLAVANGGADSVSVLQGSGDGTFLPGTTFATGAMPRSVVVTDANGDASPDLVVASFGDDAVSVLGGDGDGGFGTAVNFPAGWGASALATGDLDADGYPDLAVVDVLSDNPDPDLGDPDPGPGAVSVLLNTTTRAPAAPSIGVATAGNGAVTVSWTAPVSDGGSPIIGYVVTPYVAGVSQGPRYVVGTATAHTVMGLANGTTYRFKVRAWNAIGVSPFSARSNAVTPAVTVPAAPTIEAATAGPGSAQVSWSAPASDGGSPIVGYVVTPYVGFVSQGPRYFVGTATTQAVTGLTNGTTYRFKVRAWNAVGVSGFSNTSNAVVPTL